MVLIQREAQLSQLRTAFDNCTNLHTGQVCLVTSGIGSGKTALLEEFTSYVAQHSAQLLSASSSRDEFDLQFGVMDQLIASSGLHRASMQQVSTAVRQLTHTTPRSARSAHGLFTSLLDLAGPVPLVVTIDDVQHADQASLQCLLYAIRRSRHKPIMVVLAESSTPRTPYPHFRAELMSQPHFSRIHLDLLTDNALARMAETHPVRGDRHSLARQAPALTGGSPLLMRALLDDEVAATTAAQALSTSETAVPPRDRGPGPDPAVSGCDGPFPQAVLRCLYRHEPEVRGAAQALAVLGRPTALPVLARLLSLTPEFTAQALQLLSQSGLVDGDRFRHPLVVSAVLADLSADEQHRLHRRAAEVLHEHGAEPGIIAEHLIGADWAEPHWAESALTEAAAQSLAAGRPDVTSACLRLVRGQQTSSTHWTEIDALSLCSRWQINPLSAAVDLSALAAADGPYSPASLAAVPALVWQGHADTACDIVEAVATLPEPSPTVQTQLETARLLISLVYPDRYQEARTKARRVTHSGTATSASGRYLDAMILLTDTVTPERHARDVVTSAELMIQRHLADDGALGLLAALLGSMVSAGRPHLVADWTRLLLDRPSVEHSPTWKAILHAIRAEAALRLGRLDEADEQARTALTVITPPAWGIAVAAPLGTLVATATKAGRFDDADRWLAKPVPAEAFRTPLGLHYLAARARYHLATGRRAAAVDDLYWCSREMETWRMDTTSLVPWRLELARVHIASGHQREAVRLLEEQVGAARSVDDGTRGAALRLLAGLVPAERSRRLLPQAVQLLEAYGDRIELARALADNARILLQAGDTNAARPLYQRAHQISRSSAVSVPRQRTAQAASEVGHYPAKSRTSRQHPENGLSQAERRVAALAAQGHTNRQISSKLFITVSTVEQHLTRVYRKLDVKQRTDLATRLTSTGAGSPQHGD